MLKNLGSPSQPFLGFIGVVAVLLFSAKLSIEQWAQSYYRIPELANNVQYCTAIASLLVCGLVAFNSSALSTPRGFYAAGIGARPLAQQLLQHSAVSSSSLFVAILVGQVPLWLYAAKSGTVFTFPFFLTLATCWLFLGSMGAFASLVGFTVRKFHPIVAALFSVLMTYFIVAFTASTTKTWAVSPLSGQFTSPFPFFSTRNWAISALVAFGVFLLFAQVLAIVVELRHRWEPQRSSLAAVLGTSAVFFIAFAAQSVVGAKPATDHDVCETSVTGIEVCVDKADSAGLKEAVENIDSVQAQSHSAPKYRHMAEYNTYRIQNKDERYVSFSMNGPAHRADLTNVALAAAGIDNCTDRLNEGAMTIERVAVYFLNQAHAYSRPLEKYGALYASYNESGQPELHVDWLSEAGTERANTVISQHWDEIYACASSRDSLRTALEATQ